MECIIKDKPKDPFRSSEEGQRKEKHLAQPQVLEHHCVTSREEAEVKRHSGLVLRSQSNPILTFDQALHHVELQGPLVDLLIYDSAKAAGLKTSQQLGLCHGKCPLLRPHRHSSCL